MVNLEDQWEEPATENDLFLLYDHLLTVKMVSGILHQMLRLYCNLLPTEVVFFPKTDKKIE